MTTQVFEVSTAFGLVTLAAALDEGLFAAADRRLLVISVNATIPEVAVGLDEIAGVPTLFDRFDDVLSYNDFIAPQHPAVWRPGGADAPRVARHLQLAWQIPDLHDVHLVVESIQVPPALTLAAVFSEARIDVYADGLMSYGPTRITLPAAIGTRVERLLHLDLVPGLVPVLLTEFDVPSVRIGRESFVKVVEELDWSPPLDDRPDGSVALVLGQYLSALEVLTVEEEDTLYLGLVAACAAAGFSTVVVKPHPSAPDQRVRRLQAASEAAGVPVLVADEPSLVECWYRHPAVGLVAGCFSTGLMTAAFFDLPARRRGTELVLQRLRPYENSNRIPVTIADALLPGDASGPRPPATAETVTALVHTVSYCMQPTRYPGLRPVAHDFLTSTLPTTARYVTKRRLATLELPGQPRPVRSSWPTRVFRQARRQLRRLSALSGRPGR
jgi:hypothetical protein